MKLLTRSVRGVTPTEAGAAVFKKAKNILQQIDATRLIAKQLDSGPAGPVAVGLPWTVSSVLGLALLDAVRKTLPSVRLEIIEGPSSLLAQMLAQGKLNVAVGFDNTVDGGLRMRPVVSEPLMLVGASGSLASQPARSSLADAARLPLLLLSRPNGIREAIERIWTAQGLTPQVVAEINAPNLLIESVRMGWGYSILPACAIEAQLRRGALDAVEIEGGRLQRTVYLCTSRLFAMSQAVEHVHDLLVRLMREAVLRGQWHGNWLGEGAELMAPGQA